MDAKSFIRYIKKILFFDDIEIDIFMNYRKYIIKLTNNISLNQLILKRRILCLNLRIF